MLNGLLDKVHRAVRKPELSSTSMTASRGPVGVWIPFQRRPVHLPLSVDHQSIRSARGVNGIIGSAENTRPVPSIVVHVPLGLTDGERVRGSVQDIAHLHWPATVVAVEHAVESQQVRVGGHRATLPTIVGGAGALIAGGGGQRNTPVVPIRRLLVRGTTEPGQRALHRQIIWRDADALRGQELIEQCTLFYKRQNRIPPAKAGAARRVDGVAVVDASVQMSKRKCLVHIVVVVQRQR